MAVFDNPDFDAHERVVFRHDPDSGLQAIIAIHNTNRGPALGGCRMWHYETSAEALTDVLRLSRGMSYKSALAGLKLGGGKSVIIGDPKLHKTPALFDAMGRFVDSLNGEYIVAEDVGVEVSDVEIMARQTDHVGGIPAKGAGNPAPATAWGIYHAMRAAVSYKLERDLQDVTVAVQGLGQVGYRLCELLANDGARLIVADLDAERVEQAVKQFEAKAADANAIAFTDADVYAPCALGGTLNDETIPALKCSVVVGSANNQLAADYHGEMLRERGILYAPDYIVNAGGVINISYEPRQADDPPYDKTKAFAHVAMIHDRLLEVFRRAEIERVATSVAADRLAEELFRSGRPMIAA